MTSMISYRIRSEYSLTRWLKLWSQFGLSQHLISNKRITPCKFQVAIKNCQNYLNFDWDLLLIFVNLLVDLFREL